MKLKNKIDSKLNSQNLNLFLKKNYASLNLQILKSATYEKKLFHQNPPFVIEEKFVQFKMLLTVIYSYHYFNKTIMFIGIPSKLVNLLAKIKHFHIFLPSTVWLNGTFANKNSIRIYLRNQKLKKTKLSFAVNRLFSIVKLPKLIVLLNPVKKSIMISEVHKLRIPIISLYTNKINAEKFTYKIPTNPTQLDLNSMFLSLLSLLLLKKRSSFNTFK